MFIVTLGNTERDMELLVKGFKTLADRLGDQTVKERGIKKLLPPIFPIAHTLLLLTPRAAFFAKAETLPIEQTPHRISAELVCPYPPGIPILFPGEVVTEGAIAYLQQVIAAGGVITGCADRYLRTLNVVAA